MVEEFALAVGSHEGSVEIWAWASVEVSCAGGELDRKDFVDFVVIN